EKRPSIEATASKRPIRQRIGRHPSTEWMARQLPEACDGERTPEYLVRDRDRVYGEVVTRRRRATGIRDRPIAPCLLWQNGSLQRECLDQCRCVWRAAPASIALFVHGLLQQSEGTHLSLNKDTPVPRAIQAIGRIYANPILG